MAYNDGGFKMTIREKTSKEEILNQLAMTLTYLETTHGIEEFSNINIYLQIYKNDERQMLIDPNNPSKQSGGFSLKPETEHKTFETLADGSKKITYKKDVDFKRIQETIEQLIKQPALSKYKPISIKKVEEARNQHESYLKEQRKKAEEEHAQAMAERRKLEQEEKDLLNSFRQMIADKFNCDIRDLSVYTISMNFVTDKNTLKKYLGSIETPKEEKIFRVTYRDQTTKKAAYSEVYDLQKNLLNTIDIN